MQHLVLDLSPLGDGEMSRQSVQYGRYIQDLISMMELNEASAALACMIVAAVSSKQSGMITREQWLSTAAMMWDNQIQGRVN